MKNRLDSIDNLTREDYKINFKLFLFRAVLTDKEGKIVNVFKKKDKGNALPGISWIAFFFGPYVAIQSRNWIYLWLYGLGTILSQVINTSIPGLTFVSILLPLIITLYYSAYVHKDDSY